MRITNFSYAAARLVALIGSIAAIVAVSWLAAVSDADLWMRILAVAFVLGMGAMASDASRKAAFWIDFDADGIRVRRLLSARWYSWREVVGARFEIETTWIERGIPFWHHQMLTFTLVAGGKVKVRISPRERQQIEAADDRGAAAPAGPSSDAVKSEQVSRRD